MSPPLERSALRTLVALNGAMFVIEGIGGYLGDSIGLIADALDMLADAVVYGLALLAIGHSAERKIQAAFAAGYLQLGLAGAAVVKLGWALVMGSDPHVGAMIAISLVALGVNAVALALLHRHRHGDVHLRAAWIFSATDVQVNLAVIVAALLVRTFDSAMPDLVVGALICLLVFRSVRRILRDARREQARQTSSITS